MKRVSNVSSDDLTNVTMELQELLSIIENNKECQLLPKTTLPHLPSGEFIFPKDVLLFYSLFGGISFFAESPYPMNIVAPHHLARANPLIAGIEGEDDASYNWFVIGKSDNSQYITIDLSIKNNGRCYDSFWDRHGIVGGMDIIAKSFTELIENLYNAKGAYLYWLEDHFHYLGDAYDE